MSLENDLNNCVIFFFFFQAEDGIRDLTVTGVQTCALPICRNEPQARVLARRRQTCARVPEDREARREPRAVDDAMTDPADYPYATHLDVRRSEEHTSELQSQSNLVCRLLLEKKKRNAHRTLTQLPRRETHLVPYSEDN